jgi:hypothetical protein
MAERRWQLRSRQQHTRETGHQDYETSLSLCLLLGVQLGLHDWQPAEDDPVASAYRCCDCLTVLGELPTGALLPHNGTEATP